MNQRQPAIKDSAHLYFVRGLPCCVCGKPPRNAAAHIRYTRADVADKRPTGMGEKPSDMWVTPLCDPGCHKEAPGSQHDGDEEEFWQRHGIDPFALARRLWIASGAAERHANRPPPVRTKKSRPRPNAAKVKRKWASRPMPKGRKFRDAR